MRIYELSKLSYPIKKDYGLQMNPIVYNIVCYLIKNVNSLAVILPRVRLHLESVNLMYCLH